MLHREFPSDLQLSPFHLKSLNPFEKLEVQLSEKIVQQNKHDLVISTRKQQLVKMREHDCI